MDVLILILVGAVLAIGAAGFSAGRLVERERHVRAAQASRIDALERIIQTLRDAPTQPRARRVPYRLVEQTEEVTAYAVGIERVIERITPELEELNRLKAGLTKIRNGKIEI